VPLEFNNGIRVLGTELWLDATRTRDISFVSHAHYDHATRHRRVIASAKTALLYRHRVLKGSRGTRTEVVGYEFGDPFRLGDLVLTLFPSGHILGASQILIETDKRIVYTGDFKVQQGLASERIEILPCDVLIMECTYGMAQYIFPDREILRQRLVNFVEQSLERGLVPVVYAYSLGKSQEAMRILGEAGFDMLVHEKVYEIDKIYEQLGVSLQRYELFTPELVPGRAVIMPPHMRRSEIMRATGRKRSVMLTGWALNKDTKRRFGVNEVIPLSDHCDFAELLAYVEIAKPKKVYTFHGPPDFAKRLKRRGYDAQHLPLGQQLHLWEDL